MGRARAHLPAGLAWTGAPAVVVPAVLADTDVSVGALGLMLAIVVLVAVFLAAIAIEVAGEHRINLERRHRHED